MPIDLEGPAEGADRLGLQVPRRLGPAVSLVEVGDLGIGAGHVVEVARGRAPDRLVDRDRLPDATKDVGGSIGPPQGARQESVGHGLPTGQDRVAGVRLPQVPEPLDGLLEVGDGVGESAPT